MQKYIIVKEWLGSDSVGSIIELEKVHPSVETNLKPVGDNAVEDVDLKKENTALKSKATKAENALKEAEAKLEEALAEIGEQEAKIAELEALLAGSSEDVKQDNEKGGK